MIFGVPDEGGGGLSGNKIMLIAVGDDIGDLTVKGYMNLGCREGEEVETAC